MTRFPFIYFLLMISMLPGFVSGQQAESVPVATLFDQLYTADTTAIEVTISTDLGRLFRDPDRSEYQDAEVKFSLSGQWQDELTGKIRLRGNMRREVCGIPPLKIKFRKQDMNERGWLPHNDLKLVLPCRDNQPSLQNLMAEYVAYQMFEQIAPVSLRVQMIRLRLVDSDGNKKDELYTAFIIEPIETLAARFNLKEVERDTYRESFLEKEEYRKMAFFQYMIGNTDWNIYNHHNLYFLAGDPYQRMLAIPYDFDYSAIVGTGYAIPYETLPIKSVSERLYRGLKCEESEALELIEEFAARENAIINTVNAHPLLKESKKKEMLSYL
ncbi:MAG: hypothetical protein KDD15_33300, partial [Lewinella sp.]|nr:hypothetical protein [Lewinella sp.]